MTAVHGLDEEQAEATGHIADEALPSVYARLVEL